MSASPRPTRIQRIYREWREAEELELALSSDTVTSDWLEACAATSAIRARLIMERSTSTDDLWIKHTVAFETCGKEDGLIEDIGALLGAHTANNEALAFSVVLDIYLLQQDGALPCPALVEGRGRSDSE